MMLCAALYMSALRDYNFGMAHIVLTFITNVNDIYCQFNILMPIFLFL